MARTAIEPVDMDKPLNHTGLSGPAFQLYMDPITYELMIDPVYTTNGETYDRWTIIDNNLTKDPLNSGEPLAIQGDNVSVRRKLFEDFPGQWEKYRQRRDGYRSNALLLAKEGSYADAITALKYVLQWNKNDKECDEALSRAETVLRSAFQITEDVSETKQDAKTLSPIKPGTPFRNDCVRGQGKAQVSGSGKGPGRTSSSELSDEIWIEDEEAVQTVWPEPGTAARRAMEKVRTIPKAHNSGWVESVNYSPDSGTRLVTTGQDKTARVWDAETGKILLILKGHKYVVGSSAWSPSGNQLATGSMDHTAKVWNATTGEFQYSLEGHEDHVCSVAWNSRFDILATGSRDGTVVLWSVKSLNAIATFSANSGAVLSVAWNQNGNLLAVAYERNSVKVWDANLKKVIFEFKSNNYGKFTSVTWSPKSSELAAANSNTTTLVYNVLLGKVRLTLTGHEEKVVCVTWSPDGTRIATASTDKTAIVWDSQSGVALFTLKAHSSPLTSVTWRKDGNRLATASEGGTVNIWECAENTIHSSKKLSFLNFRF